MSVTAVNQLMKQYGETRKQVKKMMAAYGMDEVPVKRGRPKKGGKKGKKKRMGGRSRMGMPGLGGMSMADLKKIQGMME